MLRSSLRKRCYRCDDAEDAKTRNSKKVRNDHLDPTEETGAANATHVPYLSSSPSQVTAPRHVGSGQAASPAPRGSSGGTGECARVCRRRP